MKQKFMPNSAVKDLLYRKNVHQPWGGAGRAYEDPQSLVRAIIDPAHRLAAQIMLESGARAEGVGFARSQWSRMRLQQNNLKGVMADPYFEDGRLAAVVETTEKGGYTCPHYLSVETYALLEDFLNYNGMLCGRYEDLLHSVEMAARTTGQYVRKRGLHGLKHCFAQTFFLSALKAGKSPESAEIETSRRCSHRRGDVYRSYYSGRRR